MSGSKGILTPNNIIKGITDNIRIRVTNAALDRDSNRNGYRMGRQE